MTPFLRLQAVVKDNTCGNSVWEAASNVARCKAQLDKTGLYLSSCRHQVTQNALNMYRGEIYAYPLLLQHHFLTPTPVMFFETRQRRTCQGNEACSCCDAWERSCLALWGIHHHFNQSVNRINSQGFSDRNFDKTLKLDKNCTTTFLLICMQEIRNIS